jgi:hypothetical protein
MGYNEHVMSILGRFDSEAKVMVMDKSGVVYLNGRTLNEICRMLKRRRAEDGFSYRTHHAGRNDPADPSTWSLPVYHASTWTTALSISRYLRAFPQYREVLSQFGVDPDSVFVEGEGHED